MNDGIESRTEDVCSEQIKAGHEAMTRCLDEVMSTQLAAKKDVSREVKEDAKQLASIVEGSSDVRSAADNPQLVKIMSDAKDSGQLDAVIKAANKILENPGEKVCYQFQATDIFGLLLIKQERADSIDSVATTQLGPLTENEMDVAARNIAKAVVKTGTLGTDQQKRDFGRIFDRAVGNHQVDDLLARINGDNLGDADVLGTHSYIRMSSVDSHTTRFTLINNDVAHVDVAENQK
jgi:hypothetical protein